MKKKLNIFRGDNPIEIFNRWLKEATKTEISDPNAISLATVDQNGLPNVRVVLLKFVEDDSFIFFTNFESTKGREIYNNNQAAFVVHWKTLKRQIRVRGSLEKETGKITDDYFATRDVQSKIGAWASNQSMKLSSEAELAKRNDDYRKFFGKNVPRPSHWGGFRLKPKEIEFWSDGQSRLHERFQWKRDRFNQGENTDSDLPWEVCRLFP